MKIQLNQFKIWNNKNKNKQASPNNKLTAWYKELNEKQKVMVKAGITAGIWLLAIVFFFLNKDCFYGVDGAGASSLLKKRTVVYFMFIIFLSQCVFLKNPMKEKANQLLNVKIMQCFPIVCFLLAEWAMGWTDLVQMKVYKVVFNLLIYYAMMYFVFALTISVRTSIILMSIVTAMFATCNIFLVQFRQIPLLASDFSIIRTAMNVASDFSYHITWPILFLICFVVACIALGCKIKQGKVKIYTRAAVGVIYVCFLVFMLKFMVFSDTLKDYKINVNTFRPIKSYTNNGGLLTFVRSIRLMMVEKPEGYDKEAAQEIAQDYPSDSVEEKNAKTPNVIVIMNEAFADLQSVGKFETNQEVLPFYNSLKKNTVKGFAYVSVFGGQTANSEFEFLTGDSKAFLPNGSTPYQLYVKQYLPSLTGNLKLNNYQGILAMHPYNASGYNRINVYNNFGFSKFITKEDFVNPKLVRNFISDESDYDRIIEEYEKSKSENDGPFYLFNVTMQNHSAYDKDFDNLPKTIQITTPECADSAAQRYLNLVHISDAQTKRLIEYFEQQKEPTVICMFGDHEPGLSDSFYESIIGKNLNALTPEENMELYKVPFFIWANYDIQEKYIEKTSLNFLQSIMLDTAGMKKSGYNKYQLELMKDVPAMNVSGYFGADGKYYSITDKNSPYFDQVWEYDILQYNHLFDKKNRMDDFFELQ